VERRASLARLSGGAQKIPPSAVELHSPDKNEVPAKKGRDFQVGIYRFEKKLRSATLTVAVLVFFVIVLALAALFRLLLTGLAALLAALSGLSTLTRLSGLSTLLALSELTLLALLFHIVCHDTPP
jgi:hypothetical protein